jgi:t-SNARE complex subunit (syntaxin)
VADSQNSTENGTLLTDDIVTTNDNISQMSSNADDIVTRLRRALHDQNEYSLKLQNKLEQHHEQP